LKKARIWFEIDGEKRDDMTAKTDSQGGRREVLLISPKVPPYGGMALQAQLMQDRMNGEGISAAFLASNLPFPKPVSFFEQIRFVRPFLRCPFFCWQLWKMSKRAEVVHILACSWLYFFVIVCPAVLISRIRGKRIILNYRGGEADEFFRRSAILIRPFFRMADVVTAPSQFLVDVIGKWIGVPVQVVPNIVNLDRFRYRARNPLQPKMVVTRHLLKLYDVESVIRAFGEVQKRYADASLAVVGTGDQESHLRSLVATLGLTKVTFRGYVPQKDLPALYDQCDILLNASLADNFPGSLVEAAAAGLVVISTGVGGIPYIFENGKSALLARPGDWEGLAAAVLRVLEDQNLAMRLIQEAVHQCRNYDWAHVRRQLYAIYEFDVLDDSPSSLDSKTVSRRLGLAVGKAQGQ
jgi:L-malate glycosyltransferase